MFVLIRIYFMKITDQSQSFDIFFPQTSGITYLDLQWPPRAHSSATRQYSPLFFYQQGRLSFFLLIWTIFSNHLPFHGIFILHQFILHSFGPTFILLLLNSTKILFLTTALPEYLSYQELLFLLFSFYFSWQTHQVPTYFIASLLFQEFICSDFLEWE